MKFRRIIILLFEFIGLLGTIITSKPWQEALYLLLFTIFFWLDCKDYFKGLNLKEKQNGITN